MTGATATQSSMEFGPGSGNPELAIDGNADTKWKAGTCTHTRREDAPWWRVTVPIASPLQITRVDVTNRGDSCCYQRLNGFGVSINGVACANNVQIGKGETKQVDCAASAPAGDLTVCAAPARRRGPFPPPPRQVQTHAAS